jgi:hypothetical protein
MPPEVYKVIPDQNIKEVIEGKGGENRGCRSYL